MYISKDSLYICYLFFFAWKRRIYFNFLRAIMNTILIYSGKEKDKFWPSYVTAQHCYQLCPTPCQPTSLRSILSPYSDSPWGDQIIILATSYKDSLCVGYNLGIFVNSKCIIRTIHHETDVLLKIKKINVCNLVTKADLGYFFVFMCQSFFNRYWTYSFEISIG